MTGKDSTATTMMDRDCAECHKEACQIGDPSHPIPPINATELQKIHIDLLPLTMRKVDSLDTNCITRAS